MGRIPTFQRTRGRLVEPAGARKYPRIPVDLSVEVDVKSSTDHARGLMLGGGGMFLGISQIIPKGTELVVRFRPAKHLAMVEAKARVCYSVDGRGIGIEFTAIDPEQRQNILRLIHHRTGERRRYPRVPLATQVLHGEDSFIGFSRDISTGGMFVETNQPLDAGATLNLRFHLESEDSIVKAEGQVLYVVPRVGVGLSFTEVMPEDYGRIQAYVAHNYKADPALSSKSNG